MKKILIITFFALITCYVSAQNNQELMTQGNEYYTNNEYKSALDTYLKILETDEVAFNLYFNIGNCYFKMEDYVRAILFYERAKLIQPDDEDLFHNLKITNQHIIDKIEVAPQLFIGKITDAFLASFHSNTWATVSVAMFWMFLILLSVFLFSNKSFVKKLFFLFAVIVLLFSVVTFFFSMRQKNALLKEREAIVMKSPVEIKSSPGENEKKLFEIHQGTKVKVLEEIEVTKEKSLWFKIKLSDGKTGWLLQTEVEVI